jgi:hypothetical protein
MRVMSAATALNRMTATSWSAGRGSDLSETAMSDCYIMMPDPGMLIMAAGHEGKPPDCDELERCTRVGYERGMRSRKGEQ